VRDGRDPTVIWVLANPGMAKIFERIVVLDGGELVEDGTYETLSARNGIFTGLLS
jgi:putative ABC transport system ATP-binding protein